MMKNALAFILALAATLQAATDSAYYRHHQRRTTVQLEADLVNREIGIDSSRSCIVGKNSVGVAFHGICKEQDTVSLAGVLNVAGSANFSGTIKASNYNAGSIMFFGTGGLYSEDGTNLIFNDGTNTLTTLNLSLIDGGNLAFGTSSGTKFGTSTSQRLGFYNATPIVQPVGTTDLRQALINLGLYATGGVSPLNLNGGAFNAGTIDATGRIAGADTVAASLGFRAGATAASNVNLYRSAANMWTTPDSLTVAGNVYVSNFGVMGGVVTGDVDASGHAVVTGKISSGDSVTTNLGFRAGGTAASNVVFYRGSADKWRTPDSLKVDGKVEADTLISRKFYVDDTTISLTMTGVSPGVSGGANVSRVGKMVMVSLSLSGTSNTNACTYGTLPVALRPIGTSRTMIVPFQDNGTNYKARVSISTAGVITVYAPDETATGFTTSGTKGFVEFTPIMYSTGF